MGEVLPIRPEITPGVGRVIRRGDFRGRPRGSARDVLDYIALIEFYDYVNGLCDSVRTAMTVCGAFLKTDSAARRGRALQPHGVPLAGNQEQGQ